jgi:hypothetical protein
MAHRLTMPAAPVIGDLIERGQRLEIGCAKCRHAALWSPEEAVLRLGAATTFVGARDRLRCSACGARNGSEGRISARPCISDYYERLREKGMGMPGRPR